MLELISPSPTAGATLNLCLDRGQSTNQWLWGPVAQRHHKREGGGKGTVTKVHHCPLNPPTDLARFDLGGAASNGKHHAAFVAVHNLYTVVHDLCASVPDFGMAHNTEAGSSKNSVDGLLLLPLCLSLV